MLEIDFCLTDALSLAVQSVKLTYQRQNVYKKSIIWTSAMVYIKQKISPFPPGRGEKKFGRDNENAVYYILPFYYHK